MFIAMHAANPTTCWSAPHSMMEHLNFDFVFLLDETAGFRPIKVNVLCGVLSPLCLLDNTVVGRAQRHS